MSKFFLNGRLFVKDVVEFSGGSVRKKMNFSVIESIKLKCVIDGVGIIEGIIREKFL